LSGRRQFFGGNDEGLLAHVGPDLQCGFNRFRKRAGCDRFSGACETDQRKVKVRRNMSDAKLRSSFGCDTSFSDFDLGHPGEPDPWRLAPELKFLMRPLLHWALQEESELPPTDPRGTCRDTSLKLVVAVRLLQIST
jgi:hypothetical protein